MNGVVVGRPLFSNLLEVVGTAFIAVAATAPISEYFQFRTLARYMRLLMGAQGAGIINIYRSRLEERAAFQSAVEDAFENAHKLNLIGIALPMVFPSLPLPKKVEKVVYDTKIPFNIILLDPDSDAAAERQEIEKGNGVRDAIRKTLGELRNILVERASRLGTTADELIKNGALDRLNMAVHLYDFPPQSMLLLTQNVLFLEEYHFGRPSGAKSGECIGGRTPVIEFDSVSDTFSIMGEHFDYVWNNKSKDITEELILGSPIVVPPRSLQ